MRSSLALAVSAVIASGALVALAPAADATATCVYRPILPAKVVVNQSVVGLRTPLAISGPADCRDVFVSTHLVHRTDDHWFLWTDTSPRTETVYAYSVEPGVYRTTASDCDAHDADYDSLTCEVVPAATTIKFGGRASLAAKRSGKRVTLTARSGRYDDLAGSAPTTTRISIQRLSGTRWTTIRHATARGKAGYTWTFTRRAKARYRVVAAENGVAFAAVSRSVKK